MLYIPRMSISSPALQDITYMQKKKNKKNSKICRAGLGLAYLLDHLYLIYTFNFGFVSRQIWTPDLNKKLVMHSIYYI